MKRLGSRYKIGQFILLSWLRYNRYFAGLFQDRIVYLVKSTQAVKFAGRVQNIVFIDALFGHCFVAKTPTIQNDQGRPTHNFFDRW
jgi:hypothetical protein